VQSQLVFELGADTCKSPPSTVTSLSSLAQTYHTAPSQRSLEIFRSLEVVNIGNMGVSIDRVGLNGKSW
jgi:hypothetical protein